LEENTEDLGLDLPLLVATLVKKCDGTRQARTWAYWTFLMVLVDLSHMVLLDTPMVLLAHPPGARA
jgi:hypothetical protein